MEGYKLSNENGYTKFCFTEVDVQDAIRFDPAFRIHTIKTIDFDFFRIEATYYRRDGKHVDNYFCNNYIDAKSIVEHCKSRYLKHVYILPGYWGDMLTSRS